MKDAHIPDQKPRRSSTKRRLWKPVLPVVAAICFVLVPFWAMMLLDQNSERESIAEQAKLQNTSLDVLGDDSIKAYFPLYDTTTPTSVSDWVGTRIINGPFPSTIKYVMGVTTGHSASLSLSYLAQGCPHVLRKFEQYVMFPFVLVIIESD